MITHRPVVGDTVHYVPYSEERACRAAVITDVDALTGLATLFVMYPTTIDHVWGVGHDEQKAKGTYHWPERAEEK